MKKLLFFVLAAVVLVACNGNGETKSALETALESISSVNLGLIM